MSFRALQIGVSGLRSHQTRLNVVSNNISNLNTVAYKRGRASFSEVLGKRVLGVERAAGGHVGRGVSVSSIARDWGQGSLNNTGIKTDLALNGDGFFIASPEKTTGNNQRRLTRAGNFTFNKDGELVAPNGLNVQGWKFEENSSGEKVLKTGELKDIRLDPNKQSPAKFTSKATVGGNLSSNAEVGKTMSISSVVYDEQGKAHNILVRFKKTADNEWDYTIKAADSSSSPFTGKATGTITFDPSGSVKSISGDTDLTWKSSEVTGGKKLDVNLKEITQFAGSTTAKFQSQNGHSAGKLAGYKFTSKGVLLANFTNGEQEKLFQLAIGDVNNPNGLKQLGENFYTTTNASGDLQIGRAGRDVRTTVESGALESSNVDLASAFSELIVAQRGYQATARVITTADQVLQQTVQLKQ